MALEASVEAVGVQDAGVAAHPAAPGKMSLSGWAWSLFEGGRDPYLILIAIYIFMPYFVTVMVGDPVRGQALVAGVGKFAGVAVALSAPFLGSFVDRLGRRKPLLLLLTCLMAPMLASLWWAKPDGSGLPVGAVIAMAAALSVVFVYSQVIHNSLLVQAAGPAHAGQASGAALGLANVFGVSSLIFVLWAFVLPGTTSLPFIPHTPLFGLDRAQHQPDRIVGPIAAGLLIAGAIPFFLFARDAAPTGARVLHSLRQSWSDLMAMLAGLKGQRNAAIFLGARIFYADAIGGIAMFLGIYAAGVMAWTTMQMLMFAICQSLFAGAGGFAAGRLDSSLGGKRALQIELMGTLLCTAGMIGMSRRTILYFWPYDPANGLALTLAGVSVGLPTIVFLLCAGGVTFWATAASGSSRTLLVGITPSERSGAFFGLFALAGTATAWLGPMLVESFTRWFGSQQMGFVPIAALLLLGFAGVSAVRPSARASGSQLQGEEAEI